MLGLFKKKEESCDCPRCAEARGEKKKVLVGPLPGEIAELHGEMIKLAMDIEKAKGEIAAMRIGVEMMRNELFNRIRSAAGDVVKDKIVYVSDGMLYVYEEVVDNG